MAKDPTRAASPTPDWVPDWARSAGSTDIRSAILLTPTGPPSNHSGEDVGLNTCNMEPVDATDENRRFTKGQSIEILVKPEPDRTVKRKLKGLHLFMISINGILGTGLYWRSGQSLEIGGPFAVLFSFILVGLLAWAVMQCITELLCIWPVPGALSVYVSTFVDHELGIAVGVAYWFAYAVSFAPLIATSSALMNFSIDQENKGLSVGIVYVLIPFIMVCVNAFGIEVYGLIEVITGAIKIAFLVVIILAMIAITGDGSASGGGAVAIFKSPFQYDADAVPNWAVALVMSISIMSFAYIGVEIVAASALEAKWPEPHRRSSQEELSRNALPPNPESLIGRTVKFSAIFMPILIGVVYTLSGILVSLNLRPDDCALPRLSWIRNTTACNWYSDDDKGCYKDETSSAFVVIAGRSNARGLDHVFNAFLVFSGLTCANTNLYVASRTLFGLTSRLDGGAGQPWVLRILAWFGRTNKRKVPFRAMVFSATAFWWVPFLQISGWTDANTPIGMFIEILSQVGSAGVIIVWACQCLAYIRYYHCINKHRHVLENRKVAQVQRWNYEINDYPYRSHGQPFLAYMALVGCLFLLFVSNGAAVWKGFHILPFLSAYLVIFIFVVSWVCLKLFRGAKWSLEDLSDKERVMKIIRHLHELRAGST